MINELGHNVPIPHFGVVLEWDSYHKFVDRLRQGNIKFEIDPYIRFKGEPGGTCHFNL